ncbi:hypothetical protein IFM89_000431 [Coptis chinensis]|uniref:Uncharacterized protein n=1 Tax=Coptis chinensis TaxID=261450 RepID=A0A835I8G4_9MAGN|nr:hypothetical protein IFM89_000431 [Coptis chinensis]
MKAQGNNSPDQISERERAYIPKMQIRALVITTKHPIKRVGEVVKLGNSTWINECCLELQKKKKDVSKTKTSMHYSLVNL